jgi:hypothetical protein
MLKGFLPLLATLAAEAPQQPPPPPTPDVPLLLATGPRRDIDQVLRDLERIDVQPLKAAIAPDKKSPDKKPSDPTIGPVRFPITSAVAPNPNNSVITASSFFPVQAYFDDAVDPSTVTSINLDPLMDIRLTDEFSLDIGAGFFWRDTKEGSSSSLITGAEAESPGLLGTELSIVLEWEINRNFSLMTSYSHFFADSFLETSGFGEDIDFFGLSAAFRF